MTRAALGDDRNTWVIKHRDYSQAWRFGGWAAVKEAGVAPLGTSRIQSSSRALSHSRSGEHNTTQSG